jgi:soluble lytic murein transglycosylase-like protein
MCLVTWSGATASDPKFSLEDFSGVAVIAKRADATVPAPSAAAAPADNQSSPNDEPLQASETSELQSAETSDMRASATSDVPIAIPEQTKIEQPLKPQPIPLPPVAKPVVHRSRQEVCDSLAKAAETNNLPLPFFIRLLFQESRFQPEAVSRAGAEGVAQFMPQTSAEMGLSNPFDPLQAIPASARLLRNLFQQFGNLGLAAAAYNAGPKRIQSWLTKKSTLPQETQGYVKTITGRPAETWKGAAAGSLAMRLPRRAPCQEAAGLYAWNGPERIPLPVPSRYTASAPAQVKTKVIAVNVKVAQHATAARKHAAPIIVAELMQTESTRIVSHKQSGVIQIAVPERAGSIQIAARKKLAAAKLGKPSSKIPPVKFAMASRNAHK